MTILPARDYVKLMNVAGNQQAYALQAFNLLRPIGKKPTGLEFIIDGKGCLALPPDDEIYPENEYAKILLSIFRRGRDRKSMRANFESMWGSITPQQRTDIIAVMGFPVMNALNRRFSVALIRTHIESYGVTKAAKTWTYLAALRLLWGLFYTKDTLLTGDAIDSAFRLYSIAEATELPVLIDDADKVGDKIRNLIKSGGSTIRGQKDQSMRTHMIRTTLTITAQHNVFFGGSLSDDLAETRRLFIHANSGQMDASQATHFENLLNNVREGGLAYHLLSDYQAAQLFEAVQHYKEITRGNNTVAGLLLGLALLGKLDPKFTDQMEWERPDEDPRRRAYEAIMRDVDRWRKGKEVRNGFGGTEYTVMDSEAKNLETMMLVDDAKSRVYLNTSYLEWINSKHDHPLKGRFRNLGGLKELEPVVREVLDCPIYDSNKNKRVGGVNGTFAVLPLDISSKSNNSLTYSLTQIIIDSIDDRYKEKYTNVRMLDYNIPDSLKLSKYGVFYRPVENALTSNISTSDPQLLDVPVQAGGSEAPPEGPAVPSGTRESGGDMLQEVSAPENHAEGFPNPPSSSRTPRDSSNLNDTSHDIEAEPDGET